MLERTENNVRDKIIKLSPDLKDEHGRIIKVNNSLPSVAAFDSIQSEAFKIIRASKISDKGYSKELTEAYRKFASLPHLNEDPSLNTPAQKTAIDKAFKKLEDLANAEGHLVGKVITDLED